MSVTKKRAEKVSSAIGVTDPFTILMIIQIILSVIRMLKVCGISDVNALKRVQKPGPLTKLLLKKAISNEQRRAGVVWSADQNANLYNQLLLVGRSMTLPELQEAYREISDV